MKTIGKLAKSIGKTIFSCQTWWFTGDFVLNQSSHSLSHVLRHAVQHFWWHGRFSRTRSAALASHVSWWAWPWKVDGHSMSAGQKAAILVQMGTIRGYSVHKPRNI
jgi:hypothetical protein